MMPLTLAQPGERVLIFRIGGSDSVRQHLSDLGFVPGSDLHVISQHGGDVIVNLMDSHLALTRQMAEKIFVQPART